MKKIFSSLFVCTLVFLLPAVSISQASKKTVKAADARYMDVGKKMLQQFASGDIESWKNSFAENAVYIWSAGDSLAGREAIANYWRDRRKNVVQSITVSTDIWLPIKINQPQQGPDLGKSATFWVHIDYHFDGNDKIDRMISYVDRSVINEATKP